MADIPEFEIPVRQALLAAAPSDTRHDFYAEAEADCRRRVRQGAASRDGRHARQPLRRHRARWGRAALAAVVVALIAGVIVTTTNSGSSNGWTVRQPSSSTLVASFGVANPIPSVPRQTPPGTSPVMTHLGSAQRLITIQGLHRDPQRLPHLTATAARRATIDGVQITTYTAHQGAVTIHAIVRGPGSPSVVNELNAEIDTLAH